LFGIRRYFTEGDVNFSTLYDVQARSYWFRLATWNELLFKLASIQLVQGVDEFRWSLTKNGKFSVSSMYKALTIPIQPVVNNKSI
jgi:hypothetical protein